MSLLTAFFNPRGSGVSPPESGGSVARGLAPKEMTAEMCCGKPDLRRRKDRSRSGFPQPSRIAGLIEARSWHSLWLFHAKTRPGPGLSEVSPGDARVSSAVAA